MKKIKKYLLLPAIVAITIISCKKEGPTTPAGQLNGKWKLWETGTDDNNDGVIESYEIKPVSSEEDVINTFKSDGTGVGAYTYNGSVEPNQVFTWSITDNDTLHMNYTAHDTIIYTITVLNASNLSLIESTSQGLVGLYFKKQS